MNELEAELQGRPEGDASRMLRTTLGLGLVVPVAGPRPFDLEVLAQLNYRF